MKKGIDTSKLTMGRKKQDSKNFFPAPPFKPRDRKAGNKFVAKKGKKLA